MEETRNSPPRGIATSAMVAMHEAKTENDARHVLTLLVDAGIRAELESHPIAADTASERVWIVVPWEQESAAELVLKERSLSVVPRIVVAPTLERARRESPHRFAFRGGIFGGKTPTISVQAQALRRAEGRQLSPNDNPDAIARVARAESPDEEFVAAVSDAPSTTDASAPIETPLPDSGPAMARIIVALFAIALGLVGQWVLSSFARGSTADLFAASARHADELWRLVTANFAHFGGTHAASNAVFGLVIGAVLFGTHGIGATMLTFLVSGALGIGAEIAGSPDSVWVAGASAGNYGLIGLWTRGQMDRARYATLPRRERMRTFGMIMLLVPGALSPVTGTGEHIAVTAHVIGFVAGFLSGAVFLRRLFQLDLDAIVTRSRRAGYLAAGVVIVALFFCARNVWLSV